MPDTTIFLNIGRGLSALREEAAVIEGLLQDLDEALSAGERPDATDVARRMRGFLGSIDRFEAECRWPVAELREGLPLAGNISLKERALVAVWLDSLAAELVVIRRQAAETLMRIGITL